jgi:hypothetical protein
MKHLLYASLLFGLLACTNEISSTMGAEECEVIEMTSINDTACYKNICMDLDYSRESYMYPGSSGHPSLLIDVSSSFSVDVVFTAFDQYGKVQSYSTYSETIGVEEFEEIVQRTGLDSFLAAVSVYIGDEDFSYAQWAVYLIEYKEKMLETSVTYSIKLKE